MLGGVAPGSHRRRRRTNVKADGTEPRPYQASWWVLKLIRVYQKLFSPVMGRNCRYLPTCSKYTYEAIERFSITKGSWLGIKRVGRCHPFAESRHDPVPSREKAT